MNGSSAKRMAVLTAIYIFFSMGGTAAFVSVFGYLPDYVGASLVQVSLSSSLNAIASALLSFVAASVFKKVGLRMCMLFSGAALIAYGLLIGLFPNLYVLYGAFLLAGVITAFAGIACASNLMVNWFGEKCTPYISMCVGASLIGCGVMQGLAGFIMASFGVSAVFVGLCGSCGIIAFVTALFIKNSPQVVTKENGSSDISKESQVTETEPVTVSMTGKNSVYKNPAVWFFFLATLVATFMVSPILTYLTLYFPQYGMSMSGASLLIMIMGFATGAFNLVGGKILEKIGVKAYTFIVIACMAVVYVFAHIYASQPSTWVIVLMVICYAVGCTCLNISAIIAPQIFGMEASSEVTTKSMGFMFAGNILCPIVIASLVTNVGFSGTWLFAGAAAGVAAILYTAVFSITKKRNAIQSSSVVEIEV